MLPPTTLERLRVFHAVSTTGTIAGAARSLGYTASAVSQQVSALEREASVALVERSNRGVSLTSAGRHLAGRASEILDVVRNAFDEVASAADRHETTLAVAAFPTAITTMLLPLRARLAPSIRLTIVDAEPDEALQALAAREVDGAIVDGYDHQRPPGPEDLQRTQLRREPIRLVTRHDAVAPSLADYAEAEWVLGGPTSRLGQAARHVCGDAGFSPATIAETDDHHIAFGVILATGAVSLLPELALSDLPEGIVVVEEIDVAVERRIEFVTRPSLGANAAVAQLTRLLAAPPPDAGT